MKLPLRNKIFALIAFFAVAVPSGSFAQHYIGAKIGYGSGTSRFYPKKEMGSVWGLYSGGVSWKYYTDEKVVGGVEVDILFMQQGYKRTGNDVIREFSDRFEIDQQTLSSDTAVYTRKVNSVMVPIFWQPHGYLFKKKMRVFLNLGVTFSYNISSEHKMWLTKGQRYLFDKKYPMKTVRDNRWGYGLVGGAGMGWIFDRFEVLGEVRYYFGYGDILRNRNKYEANPMRSPLDDIQITIGAYYKLGNNKKKKAAALPAALPAVNDPQPGDGQITQPDTGPGNGNAVDGTAPQTRPLAPEGNTVNGADTGPAPESGAAE